MTAPRRLGTSLSRLASQRASWLCRRYRRVACPCPSPCGRCKQGQRRRRMAVVQSRSMVLDWRGEAGCDSECGLDSIGFLV